MNAQQELNVEEALNAAFEAGFQAGVSASSRWRQAPMQDEAPRRDMTKEILEAKLKLVNAVGQTIQANSSAVQGLAMVLDNFGNLR
jgi:hypothetical protein